MLDCLASHLDAIAACAPLWGYAFIFIFMAVESSFIPFPSEIVMIPAGFLAARGELSFHAPVPDLVAACLAGLAGSLAGAYFNYFLSARLGEPFLRKYGKWFFVKPEALDRACDVFNRYGGATTFVCRLIPVIRQLISIPAGLARMPLAKFTLFTGLGAGVWTVVLALAGYGIGRSAGDIAYRELVHRGKATIDAHLPWIVLGALVLGAAYAVLSRLAMRRRPARAGQSAPGTRRA
ncbi:MAG: DedA family protein [Kiritimatiellia bacterium]